MKKHLILASRSPRRRDLVALCGLPFESLVPKVDEAAVEASHQKNWIGPYDTSFYRSLVENLAHAKAKAVLELDPEAVVLGSDSIVVSDGIIMGKPQDADHARIMLNQLSGKAHRVYTGVCLLSQDQKDLFSQFTEVHFYPLDEQLIDAYIASGSPMDKAGAYGIQDMGALFVEKINGDYYTVMGLPIARVYRLLKARGLV